MTGTRTRFAPSPTGYLHLGHAASAAHAFGFGRKHGAICLLRIEDIDATRCKPKFEEAILEDLHWLGFNWPEPVRRQSDHLAQYQNTLETLIKNGLVYRCFKTRKQVLEEGAPAPFDKGQERKNLELGLPYAWRLSLAACQVYLGADYNQLFFVDNGLEIKARPERLGDVILARKDVGTSYHLACCHDDAHQNITHIVRGQDLFDSTHIHRLLQEVMDWPTPKYFHHPLLTDKDGKKLSKRDKSLTIRELRRRGWSAQKVLARAQGLG